MQVSQMPASVLHEEIRRVVAELDTHLAELRKAAEEEIDAEHEYRLAAAIAYLKSEGKNKEARESDVFLETKDLRKAARIAEALKHSAREALAAKRSQLSAYQTLAAAYKEEARLGTSGPAY